MANLFNSVKVKNHKRNKFNLSHSSRLTTEFGRLTPILCEPVIPADQFKVNTTLKVRFAPMTFPVMERFKAYVHYWYVPNRLLWDNWEDFITGGETGLEDMQHPYPVIKLDSNIEGVFEESNIMNGSLFDYLGFPAKELTQNEKRLLGNNPKYFDALPFKAYQLIWSEFYRDQNLEQEFPLRTDLDGVQNMIEQDTWVNSLMSIRYRAWKKDYFTSALPDPQRGPDVTIPYFGDLDVVGDGNATIALDQMHVKGGTQHFTSDLISHSSGGSQQFIAAADADKFMNDDEIEVVGSVPGNNLANALDVDAANMRMASINDLRRGFALQRLYELAARVGGRYAENILGNFGVYAGDARLQRPEYLGGSVVPIYVGDVLQTSETTDEGTPLGMPAGVAGAIGSAKAFSRTFKEHGWIIGILSILPEATYMQGIPRKFLKRDRLDFAWPLFANIGEQEIENQELYFDFAANDEYNKGGFGYTPRYAEYRFGMSGIHGDFRDTLADFHDARMFDSRPALNAEFVHVKPTGNHTGLNRIFAVNDVEYDHIWVHLYNDIVVRRKLPKYGTPI